VDEGRRLERGQFDDGDAGVADRAGRSLGGHTGVGCDRAVCCLSVLVPGDAKDRWRSRPP
jgi:hypothetical protein